MSDTDELRALLAEMYDGERLGVALAHELARLSDDESERELCSLFEQVEIIARDALAPIVALHGVTGLSDAETEAGGVALAKEMSAKPSAEAWSDLLPEIERFLDCFVRLRELGDSADREALDVLVEHEDASVEMARCEVAGDREAAVAALRAFLDDR